MSKNTKNTSATSGAIEKRENQGTVNVPERIEQATYYTPLVDIAETADGYMFLADLPGVKPADLDVTYDNGTLAIEGKVAPRQPAVQQFARREYGVGHFYRSFHLNTDVHVDGIRAELKNGQLSLFVPKAEHAKSRKIQISTGA